MSQSSSHPLLRLRTDADAVTSQKASAMKRTGSFSSCETATPQESSLAPILIGADPSRPPSSQQQDYTEQRAVGGSPTSRMATSSTNVFRPPVPTSSNSSPLQTPLLSKLSSYHRLGTYPTNDSPRKFSVTSVAAFPGAPSSSFDTDPGQQHQMMTRTSPPSMKKPAAAASSSSLLLDPLSPSMDGGRSGGGGMPRSDDVEILSLALADMAHQLAVVTAEKSNLSPLAGAALHRVEVGLLAMRRVVDGSKGRCGSSDKDHSNERNQHQDGSQLVATSEGGFDTSRRGSSTTATSAILNSTTKSLNVVDLENGDPKSNAAPNAQPPEYRDQPSDLDEGATCVFSEDCVKLPSDVSSLATERCREHADEAILQHKQHQDHQQEEERRELHVNPLLQSSELLRRIHRSMDSLKDRAATLEREAEEQDRFTEVQRRTLLSHHYSANVPIASLSSSPPPIARRSMMMSSPEASPEPKRAIEDDDGALAPSVVASPSPPSATTSSSTVPSPSGNKNILLTGSLCRW